MAWNDIYNESFSLVFVISSVYGNEIRAEQFVMRTNDIPSVFGASLADIEAQTSFFSIPISYPLADNPKQPSFPVKLKQGEAFRWGGVNYLIPYDATLLNLDDDVFQSPESPYSGDYSPASHRLAGRRLVYVRNDLAPTQNDFPYDDFNQYIRINGVRFGSSVQKSFYTLPIAQMYQAWKTVNGVYGRYDYWSVDLRAMEFVAYDGNPRDCNFGMFLSDGGTSLTYDETIQGEIQGWNNAIPLNLESYENPIYSMIRRDHSIQYNPIRERWIYSAVFPAEWETAWGAKQVALRRSFKVAAGSGIVTPLAGVALLAALSLGGSGAGKQRKR